MAKTKEKDKKKRLKRPKENPEKTPHCAAPKREKGPEKARTLSMKTGRPNRSEGGLLFFRESAKNPREESPAG